jgi:hypothetical protein
MRDLLVDRGAQGQVFLGILQFSRVGVLLMLHIHSYIIWEMDKGPVSGCSYTEALSHPIIIIAILKIPF